MFDFGRECLGLLRCSVLGTYQVALDRLLLGAVVGLLYLGLFERVRDVQRADVIPSVLVLRLR